MLRILSGCTLALLVSVFAQPAFAGPDTRVRALDKNAAMETPLKAEVEKSTVSDKAVQGKMKHPLALSYSNGKPGKMHLLNVTMLIKSGALSKINATKDNPSPFGSDRAAAANRRWPSNGKKGKQSQLNLTWLIKSGAFARPDTIRDSRNAIQTVSARQFSGRRWASNGKKGKQSQLNVSMLIKSGAMQRPDTIRPFERTIRQTASHRRPTTTRRPNMGVSPRHEAAPPRALNHERVFRRDRVGNFCHGRSCER